MKKTAIIVLFLAIAGISLVDAQKLMCKIKGSDTCLPILQKESENYQKKNAGSIIMVTGGGSGVGFTALLAGTTDIAMASRSMQTDERMKMQESGKAYKEVLIGRDAISVIVNSANKINQLTREQIEGIFTGKITNWKQVGGDDMAIVVYSRETSSGTYDYFKNHALKNKNYCKSALMMPATGAIVQSVSQTKGAIGYVGLAYVDNTVKALKLSFDKGKKFVEPSKETTKNKTYPLARNLYLYFLTKDANTLSPFVNYVLSDEGQKTILEVGYVPL